MLDMNARAVWAGNVRPWLKKVIFSVLFLTAALQSASFFTKFIQPPVTSSIHLEKLSPAETPWFTFCPHPGVNYLLLEYLYPDAKDTWKTGRPRTLDGFSKRFMSKFLPRAITENESFTDELQRIFDEIASPVWEYTPIVSIYEGRKGDYLSPVLYGQHFNLTHPMVAYTSIGSWETFILPRIFDSSPKYPTWFHICSTFKPNFSIASDKVPNIQFGFSYNVSYNYDVTDEVVASQFFSVVGNGDDPTWLQPSLYMFVTQPGTLPYSYQSVGEDGETVPYRRIELGEQVQWHLLNVERYEFVNKKADPCKEYMEEDGLSHVECHANCFESSLLYDKYGCRLPGHRRVSLDPNLQKPPFAPLRVCNSTSDLLASMALLSKHNRLAVLEESKAVYKRCQELCLKPCTRIRYDWIDMPRITKQESLLIGCHLEDPLTVANSPEGLLHCGDGHMIEIIPKQTHLKVISEEFAYSVNQLISDLGGSWGLLLGVSFVTILSFMDDFFLVSLPVTVPKLK